MTDWISLGAPELQQLANRLKQTAPLTISKLVKTAGISRQALDYWCAGRSLPEPENLASVGEALELHGRRLTALGGTLREASQREEKERRATQRAQATDDELSLFP